MKQLDSLLVTGFPRWTYPGRPAGQLSCRSSGSATRTCRPQRPCGAWPTGAPSSSAGRRGAPCALKTKARGTQAMTPLKNAADAKPALTRETSLPSSGRGGCLRIAKVFHGTAGGKKAFSKESPSATLNKRNWGIIASGGPAFAREACGPTGGQRPLRMRCPSGGRGSRRGRRVCRSTPTRAPVTATARTGLLPTRPV